MDQLDDLFGTFTKEIKLAATEKDFKGTCYGCKEPIISKEVGLKAMGNTYHPDHFKCQGCQKVIARGAQFLIDAAKNHPYHQECYEKAFLETCQHCQKHIKEGRMLHAAPVQDSGKPADSSVDSSTMKHAYHMECFTCGMKVQKVIGEASTGVDEMTSAIATGLHNSKKQVEGCSKALMSADDVDSGGNALKTKKYWVYSDTVYCRPCYEEHIVPNCAKCNRKILGELAPPDVSKDQYGYYVLDGETFCHQHRTAKSKVQHEVEE